MFKLCNPPDDYCPSPNTQTHRAEFIPLTADMTWEGMMLQCNDILLTMSDVGVFMLASHFHFL